MTVTLDDFNAKTSNWYEHDKTTYEDSKIEAITSQFGLKQLNQEPTQMKSGVHSSFHENCHH